MTGLNYLLICFLYFVCIGLDIAMFFSQIRLLVLWRNINWLVPFDNVGEPIVNAITAKVSQLSKTSKPLTEKGKLIVALAVFVIARIILGSILKAA